MNTERTIDRDSKEKLYVQIYSIIREKIEGGEWPAGTQIPTEDDLCKSYDVSKVTVREAVQELVREGYLRRQQGKGTFVLYSLPNPGPVMRTRLTDVTNGKGMTVRREILERGLRDPSRGIKEILKTADRIHYVLCKKYTGGGPSIIEGFFLPAGKFLAIDDEDILYKSFLDLIDEKGTKKISRVVQTSEISAAKKAAAVSGRRKDGPHSMVVGRIFIGADGNPVAYSRCILNAGDKVRMEFERIK